MDKTAGKDKNDAEYFDWDPDEMSERGALDALAANAIREWRDAEEDALWR